MITIREVNAAATRALTLAGNGEARGWVERLIQISQEVLIERDALQHRVDTLENSARILAEGKMTN